MAVGQTVGVGNVGGLSGVWTGTSANGDYVGLTPTSGFGGYSGGIPYSGYPSYSAAAITGYGPSAASPMTYSITGSLLLSSLTSSLNGLNSIGSFGGYGNPGLFAMPGANLGSYSAGNTCVTDVAVNIGRTGVNGSHLYGGLIFVYLNNQPGVVLRFGY